MADYWESVIDDQYREQEERERFNALSLEQQISYLKEKKETRKTF